MYIDVIVFEIFLKREKEYAFNKYDNCLLQMSMMSVSVFFFGLKKWYSEMCASTSFDEPLSDWYAAECAVQHLFKQSCYALRGGWSHLLHQLIGIGVQELIDGFA